MKEFLRPTPETYPIGTTVIEGLIHIDQGIYLRQIEELVDTMSSATPTDAQIFETLQQLPGIMLIDSITAWRKGYILPPVQIANSNIPASMSEIVQGGFGMCRHFTTLSALAARYMNVPFEILGNRSHRHTFGAVKLSNEWQIVDPFAFVFYPNNGKPPQLWPSDCYTSPDVIKFEFERP